MGVSTSTRQYLEDNEGLTFAHKLIDYVETETWKKTRDIMRRPPMIPDPANMAEMIHQAAFLLSFKSLVSLRITAVAVFLFSKTYGPRADDIMMYDSHLKNFKVHMDAIKEDNNNDNNDPPKLSRNIPIEEYIKGLDVVFLFSKTYGPRADDIMVYDSHLKNLKVHMDAIKEDNNNDNNDPPKLSRNISIEEYIKGLDVYFGGKIGAINCPMRRVTRENVLVPAYAPPMTHKQLYSI